MDRPVLSGPIRHLGRQLFGPGPYMVEHFFGQFPGEGVLLAWVEGGEDGQPLADLDFQAVGKTGARGG